MRFSYSRRAGDEKRVPELVASTLGDLQGGAMCCAVLGADHEVAEAVARVQAVSVPGLSVLARAREGTALTEGAKFGAQLFLGDCCGRRCCVRSWRDRRIACGPHNQQHVECFSGCVCHCLFKQVAEAVVDAAHRKLEARARVSVPLPSSTGTMSANQL